MINWQNIVNILKYEPKCFSLCILFDTLLYKLIRVQAKIDKEWGTFWLYRNANYLLQNVPFYLNKYVIDQESYHTDAFVFCVAHFGVCFVLDK